MSEQMHVDRAFMNSDMNDLHTNGEKMTHQEDQLGKTEWQKYLQARPTLEEASYHPKDGRLIEPDEYFDSRRQDHYDQTHENPAELSPGKLFDQYIKAETSGNKTFVEDYGEILANKLNSKTVSPSELAEMQAIAEHESEIGDMGASRTAKLVADVIDKKVVEFHNRNIGKSETYQVRGEDGQLRTITPLEDAAIGTDRFRDRIKQLKEGYLSDLRQEDTGKYDQDRDRQEADNQKEPSEQPNMIDWVKYNDDSSSKEGEVKSNQNYDNEDDEDWLQDDYFEGKPQTEEQPAGDEELEDDEGWLQDDYFEGKPQTEEQPAGDEENENARFVNFKKGVRRHLREHPIKDAPPKPEDYEHPLDKFDRLYTFPFKAKVNGRAAELRDSLGRAAGRGMERHKFLRRAGQVALSNLTALPQGWDEFLISASEPLQDDESEAPTEIVVEQPADPIAPEMTRSTNKKAGHLGRVLLRNMAILYDEIQESFRRSQEESGKKATP